MEGSSERMARADVTSLQSVLLREQVCPPRPVGLPASLGLSCGSFLTSVQRHSSSAPNTRDCPGTKPPVSRPSPNSGTVSFSAAPSSTDQIQKRQMNLEGYLSNTDCFLFLDSPSALWRFSLTCSWAAQTIWRTSSSTASWMLGDSRVTMSLCRTLSSSTLKAYRENIIDLSGTQSDKQQRQILGKHANSFFVNWYGII